MTVSNFIPEVWASAILDNLNNAHVYANCVNRDYEGEIKGAGDVVRINSIGRVTISDYTKNTWTMTPEVLDGAGQTLLIDQAKSFYFGVDDVDKAQAKPTVMEAAMKEAAWGIADATDTFLATTLSTAATANVLTAATVGPNDSDAYEILVDMRVALDVTNTPQNDRWAVVPPWFIGELLKDPRFVSFGTSENLSRAMQGAIKMLSGFDLYVSNNVPVTGGAYTVIAGYKGAATYAESIPEGHPEAFRHPDGFVDVVRSLHVSGAKVTRPSNLATIVVTRGV